MSKQKAAPQGYCCRCHDSWYPNHRCKEPEPNREHWRQLDTEDDVEFSDTERLCLGFELLRLEAAGLPWDSYNRDVPDPYEALYVDGNVLERGY